jgi:hypothetical protein
MEELLVPARRALGHAGQAVAWAEGRALALEQALADAPCTEARSAEG